VFDVMPSDTVLVVATAVTMSAAFVAASAALTAMFVVFVAMAAALTEVS